MKGNTMKPRFIMSTIGDGTPVAINTHRITSVHEGRDPRTSVVCFDAEENYVTVSEPFAALLQKIDPPVIPLAPPSFKDPEDYHPVFYIALHDGPPGPGHDQNVVGRGRIGTPIAPDPTRDGMAINGVSLWAGDTFVHFLPLAVPRKIVPGGVYSLL